MNRLLAATALMLLSMGWTGKAKAAGDMAQGLVDTFSIACLADLSDLDGYEERLLRAGYQRSKRDSGRTKGDVTYWVAARPKPRNDLCGGSVQGADPIQTGDLVLQKLASMGIKVKDATRKRKETIVHFSSGSSEFEIAAIDMAASNLVMTRLMIYRK